MNKQLKTPLRTMIAITLVLSASACGLFDRGPANVAKEYIQDLAKGDTKDLNRILYWGNTATESASSFVESEHKADSLLEAVTTHIKNKGGINSMNAVQMSTYTNGNSHLKMARVKLKIHYNDGSDEQLDIKTVYANGRWLVVSNL